MRNRPWASPSPAPAADHGGLVRARQDSSNVCLPQALISAVPNCAVSCLQTFATTNYPGSTCANTSDLNFLCTQDNTSDLTIGEAAVQCVVSFCRGQDQLNVGAFSVCIGVQGALPNTAQTITATLIGTSTTSATMSSNLPATISNPATTQEVSMIVMDSGTPVGPTTLTAATSSGSSTAQSPPTYTTAGAVAMPNQGGPRGGLGSAQVVGIAVGGAAIAVGVFALLMFIFCIRKRRQEKRRSQRRSRIIETTPPPNYQAPTIKESAAFVADPNLFPVPSPSGRFYAPQQAVEENRRSFWRKSIKPEDIGVAVSPRAPGDVSPISASSQHSISRLLPMLPNRALMPAPLDIEASRERRKYPQRPMSDGTMSDIESGIQPTNEEAIYIGNQPFILEKPPLAKRLRTAPPPITLPPVPENSVQNRRQEPASAARIPLTPTYDNGNIDITSPPFSASTGTESVVTVSQFPLPTTEHRLAPSSTYATRNMLKKKPPTSVLPLRAVISPPIEPLEQPRNPPPPPSMPPVSRQPARPVSLSSEYTTIEEDTTPEELNRQLGMPSKPSAPRNSRIDGRPDDVGQGSPIRDLKYPQIPRSAAVSRQAERPAQPRGAAPPNPFSPASAPRPTQDPVLRVASFLQSDTASSDGYMSDETIEWPVPPTSEVSSNKEPGGRPPVTQNTLKQKMARLRNAPTRASRGTPLAPIYSPSLNEMMAIESQLSPTKSSALMPERSPSTKAKLTPSKAENGDLYLTVHDI
ncbi:uncharacterized protein A1O9_05393 [Exophiala aquamarina CBS 119918]|uniref:Extracellular membrane protein CFEM domain-containing protein n=1 Tax=Exophiala aquamarina CBS 119918 TaxID=1182545 RepID=A0A072PC96_9EURO|nr:uncharacterized protein A1O9_05393 [Exophiala aquamarina CBS 119918]KEF57476.1 hypothetical protein A1O9_05393 [Exophiala aquamarina CBS 119918]